MGPAHWRRNSGDFTQAMSREKSLRSKGLSSMAVMGHNRLVISVAAGPRLLEDRPLTDAPEKSSSLSGLCASDEPPESLGRVGGEKRDWSCRLTFFF